MDLYTFIKTNLKNEKSFSSCHELFNVDISQLNAEDKDIFVTLRDISSIYLSVDLDKFEIIPMWKSVDNKSTFSYNDFNEEIVTRIKHLQIDRLPYIIQAKIYELIYYHDKNYKNANYLLSIYDKMSDLEIIKENWINLKDIIVRILQILKEQSKESENKLVYRKLISCIEKFYDFGHYFISIAFIKIFVFYVKDYNTAISYLDKIITLKSKDLSVSFDILEAYDEKSKVLRLLKKVEEAVKTEISKADKCVEIANMMNMDNVLDLQRIDSILTLAAGIYTKYARDDQDTLVLINNKILDVRKKLFNLSPKIKNELCLKEADKYIEDNFNGLTFEEAVVGLTQCVGFYDAEEMEKHTIDIYSKNILTAMSGFYLYDPRTGLITCRLKPLQLENMKDSEDFDKYVDREYIKIIDRVGLQFISRIIKYIRKNYKFSIESFNFLIENNANIPEGKEMIIKKGISLFFLGDIDVALYVLVPQIEEMLRLVIVNAGGSIVDNKIDNKDGSTMFLTLTKVLSNEFLNETIEEDVIKSFKCILDSKSGLNLRNLLLHGLMYDNETYSGGAIYLLVLIIKWITFGSYNCRKITFELKDRFPKTKLPDNLFNSRVVSNIV